MVDQEFRVGDATERLASDERGVDGLATSECDKTAIAEAAEKSIERCEPVPLRFLCEFIGYMPRGTGCGVVFPVTGRYYVFSGHRDPEIFDSRDALTKHVIIREWLDPDPRENTRRRLADSVISGLRLSLKHPSKLDQAAIAKLVESARDILRYEPTLRGLIEE